MSEESEHGRKNSPTFTSLSGNNDDFHIDEASKLVVSCLQTHPKRVFYGEFALELYSDMKNNGFLCRKSSIDQRIRDVPYLCQLAGGQWEI